MMLTQQRLKELTAYDPSTGAFTALVQRKKCKVGDVLGGPNSAGYILLTIDGKLYSAHRLAFLYMTGRWPSLVDHINRDRADNRWVNLREATPRENSMNRKLSSRNKSGQLGVFPHRGGWRVVCYWRTESFFLGDFKDKDEACRTAREFYTEKEQEEQYV